MKSNCVICIDIDDCLLPINNSLFSTAFVLEQFELNLKILSKYIKRSGFDLFLTSTWSKLFDFDSETKSVQVKEEFSEDILCTTVKGGVELIDYYLNGLLVGISSGNRSKDIEELSSDYDYVVALDDLDLSDLEEQFDNFKYIPTYGAIVPYIIYSINKFVGLKDR